MNKVILFVACMVFCAAQTEIVNAQSVSSGMMSGASHHKKLRVSQHLQVTPPVRARRVASPRSTADPITTGSVSKKPLN
jgi:hypothetical protein